MIRFATILALVMLVAGVWAQTASNLLGSWKFDPKTISTEMRSRNIVMTFKSGGQYTISGVKMVGEGTYSFAKGKLYLAPSIANGKKVPRGAGEATGQFAEQGKALLIDSGQKVNGKPKLFRLIRKK